MDSLQKPCSVHGDVWRVHSTRPSTAGRPCPSHHPTRHSREPLTDLSTSPPFPRQSPHSSHDSPLTLPTTVPMSVTPTFPTPVSTLVLVLTRSSVRRLRVHLRCRVETSPMSPTPTRGSVQRRRDPLPVVSTPRLESSGHGLG